MKTLLDGRVFTRGRIVHFVDDELRQWPFLLVTCKSANGKHTASGWVFGPERIEAYEEVPYDITQKAETFHFPSMRPKNKDKKPQPGKPLYDLTTAKK